MVVSLPYCFRNEMPYGCHRMIDNHPWPRIAHHCLNPFFHIRMVAMHSAFSATGLILSKRAFRQTNVSILHKVPAIGAQLPIAFLATAIYPNHLRHSLLFLFDPCHFYVIRFSMRWQRAPRHYLYRILYD